MRRKINGIVLLLTGILMLGGCGSDDREQIVGKVTEIAEDTQQEILVTETEKPEDTQSVPDTETEILKTEIQETEISETEGSEAEIPETETEKNSEWTASETDSGEIPVISIKEDQKEWYSEDGEEVVYRVKHSIVTVENEGFDVLKDVFAKRWVGVGDEANWEDNVQDAKRSYERTKEDGTHFFGPYSSTDCVTLERSGSSFVSLYECSGIYWGAASGSYGFYGLTFDTKSGKELQLCDILSDEEGFCREVAEYIAVKFDEEFGDSSVAESYRGADGKYLPEKFEEDVKGVMKAPADPNLLSEQWYLSEEGFVFVYQEWSLGYHPETLVTVPYAKINQYMKAGYAKP